MKTTPELPQVNLNPEVAAAEAGLEYKLLTGHRRTDGSYKTSDQLRTEYVHRADTLIHAMTEGVEVRDRDSFETSKLKPDYVIFLDKSARPVAWLIKELWPKLAPGPDDETVPERPQFRFANIDREQWVNSVDPGGTGYMDINRIDASVIRSLRSIFVSPKDKEKGLVPDIDDAPAELDGKTVLIVDEVRASGRTLDIAEKFFKRAFPTANVATAHWMGGQTQKGMGVGNSDLPVWYKEKVETGRGIANRDERASGRSNSITQRLGSWFLSTRFPTMDPDSLRLRQELHQLANDKDVLIVPDYHRDDFVERAEKLNNMDMKSFLQAKTAINEQHK